MHAAVHHVAEQVDDLRAHAGSACRKGVGPEHEDRPHDVLWQGRTDADRVATHEIALQGPKLVVRDAHGRQIAEAGIDPVHGLVGASHVGDDLRGLLHLPLRRPVEADSGVAARDRDDVGDREVVTGEPEGGYFKFSRYQAPSSV
jgi:hypothetical protein